MEVRRDPWRVACPLIETAYEIAKAYAPWARATIGDVKISPGSRNTVPERLVVSVDLRHPHGETLKSMVEQFQSEAVRISSANNITVRVDEIWHMPPTDFDAHLIELVDDAAQALGLSRRRMVSGAGHDSLHTAQFALSMSLLRELSRLCEVHVLLEVSPYAWQLESFELKPRDLPAGIVAADPVLAPWTGPSGPARARLRRAPGLPRPPAATRVRAAPEVPIV